MWTCGTNMRSRRSILFGTRQLHLPSLRLRQLPMLRWNQHRHTQTFCPPTSRRGMWDTGRCTHPPDKPSVLMGCNQHMEVRNHPQDLLMHFKVFFLLTRDHSRLCWRSQQRLWTGPLFQRLPPGSGHVVWIWAPARLRTVL